MSDPTLAELHAQARRDAHAKGDATKRANALSILDDAEAIRASGESAESVAKSLGTNVRALSRKARRYGYPSLARFAEKAVRQQRSRKAA